MEAQIQSAIHAVTSWSGSSMLACEGGARGWGIQIGGGGVVRGEWWFCVGTRLEGDGEWL